jgi:hypothetical protein
MRGLNLGEVYQCGIEQMRPTVRERVGDVARFATVWALGLGVLAVGVMGWAVVASYLVHLT